MFALLSAVVDRMKSLLSGVAEALESELDAGRDAGPERLLRLADRYQEEGLDPVAEDLRRQAEAEGGYRPPWRPGRREDPEATGGAATYRPAWYVPVLDY